MYDCTFLTSLHSVKELPQNQDVICLAYRIILLFLLYLSCLSQKIETVVCLGFLISIAI